jgi:hypothetical protein
MIQVRRTAEHDSFEVVVREGKGESRHHVTMSREMCERLTAGRHPNRSRSVQIGLSEHTATDRSD